jgi:protein-S-isoprenylcysteine O-methyltransferase Ste14
MGLIPSSHADRARGTHVLRTFLISLAASLVFVAVVLASAGRIDVWQAWVYAGISLALNIAQRVLLRANPELAKERAKPGSDARASDKALLGVGLLLTLAMLATAGLQFRYLGRPSLSMSWFVVGLALQLVGAFLFLWALRENAFFSAVVRVQADRKQVVCTTGPYRLVRHPGNLGMIIGAAGIPLLFQSTWSCVPAALFVGTLVVRTQLEDRLLAEELDGYVDYQRQTKFRLVPGLW